MNILQELFYQYMNSDRIIGHAESGGTLKAWDSCGKLIAYMPEAEQIKLNDTISDYGREREELGFINGFRYGVEIIATCFIDKGGIDNE